jgi:hypothetical protein
MQVEGLTTFALVFMLVSMGAVTLLMAYCYYRILTSGSAGHAAAPGFDAGSDGGGGPGGAE